MKYSVQAISDQGAFRCNNEDAIKYGFFKEQDLTWMIIADGMGGHLAGEVASQILVDTVEAEINLLLTKQHKKPQESIEWRHWISDTLQAANLKIFNQSRQNLAQKGMGTTAVLLIIDQDQAYIGWVGDSRAYLFQQRDKEPVLTQLTRDHTMIQVLLDKGAISDKEAAESNQKNMLSKALGVTKEVTIDCICQTVQPLDILLLSTDGLHDSLSTEFLVANLLQIAKDQPVVYQLVDQAIAAGSKDNITFGSILLRNE